MMAAVFSMQDLIVQDKGYIDHVWRIVLGFDIVPGVIALYFRLTIPETPRYTMDVLKDIEKGSRDIDDVLSNKNDKNKEKTSLSIEIPRIGLNNSIILEAIGFASSTDVYMPVGNIIITMLGTVPGYWFTVFLVDKWGHGISAASGKLGAVVVQIGFVNFKDIGGKNRLMNRLILIFAAFMFVGIWSTLLIPETMNQSLEELSNEDQIGFVKKSKVNDENSTTKSGNNLSSVNDFSDVTSSTI
ncbi:34557_t:CDS:2 [Gigaspora margarita]|uniref:34557_t:CDS:1 n=1 Tax=Gigaspora margarita TaxID=4874 RepID=A0ABN7VYD9_GIGMA|nr:34557_t:CDS:2 [Gigaspora margarita]